MSSLIRFFLIAVVAVFFTACSNDDPKMPDDNINESPKIAAINLVGSDIEADVCFLAEDGSNIICKVDTDKEVCYFDCYDNPNSDSPIFSMLIDSNGYPLMMKTKDASYIFRNIDESTFDVAVIDQNNKINYYWDVPYSFGPRSRGEGGGFTDAVKAPFIKWWHDVSMGFKTFTWDEHSRNNLPGYFFKVVSFAITAGVAVYGGWAMAPGVLVAMVAEGQSSGLWGNTTTYIFTKGYEVKSIVKELKWTENGGWKIAVNKWNLSASALNATGEFIYKYNSHIEPEVQQVFDSEEWQFHLSSPCAKFTEEGGTVSINVTTQTYAWIIDESSLDHSWCRVKRGGDSVTIIADPFEDGTERSCSITICSSEMQLGIADVKINIIQTGTIFKVTPDHLEFSYENSSKTVTVELNPHIMSWELSVPQNDWLSVKKGETSFSVEVSENKLSFDRDATIGIIAITDGGSRISQSVIVTQHAKIWDYTKWHVTGELQLTDHGKSKFLDINGEMVFENISEKPINISQDGYEIKYYVNESGQLVSECILNQYESLPGGYVSINVKYVITFDRTSATTAKGTASGNEHIVNHLNGINGYHEEFDVTLSGALDAVLQTTEGRCKNKELHSLDFINFLRKNK